MPLAAGKSPEVVSRNIREMIAAGHPQRQAIAAALRNTKANGGFATDAQKEAGNYRKRHVAFNGLNISIENEKGSKRSGVGPNGRWECTVPADYGYIKRTEGADGDHVDCYLGPHKDSHVVFVIDQIDPKTGRFDEHKCFLGFRSEGEALKVYDAGFSDGSGPKRRSHLQTMSLDAFKRWLKEGDQTKRIARKGGGDVRMKIHVGPIHSKVAGRTDHLPMHVPSDSYVIPADIISAMGEGNTSAGFVHAKRLFGGTPYGGQKVPFGMTSAPYGMDLPHKANGGQVASVPIVAAGGEYVVHPEDVARIGGGDVTLGHRALDSFIKKYREKTIKKLKSLPGPAKS